jgi:xylan 1,4-beta-xylosidase
MSTVTFSYNLIKSKPSQFPHFWENCIGSGHATLALRADWQQQLTRCKKELGFRHVRFHGILSDDMGTLVIQNDEMIFSFFNTDQILDFLRSIDMRPFIELSFMPLALSSGSDTVFKYQGNITPPKNYASWGNLIFRLVQHWKERYGADELKVWFFEIWNEPNLKAFWKGTQADYFKLYQVSAKAIKKVHPDLKVGGPATAKNAWITPFINFCKKNKLPLDFISTHHYPTDAFGKPGDDTIQQLAKSKRSILQADVKKTNKLAGKLPVYYTEWSTSSNPFDELHDHAYAAAYITKTIMEAGGYVEGYSYWTFSDIFEENYFSSIPFHGGFGLLNIYGIPKPAYRAYQLLHNLGDKRFKIHGQHQSVDIWIIKKATSIQILLINSILPTHPQKTELVNIVLQIEEKVVASYVERIDAAHANSTNAWIDMGSPDSLSAAQVASLEKSSSLVKEPFGIKSQEKTITINIDIPPQGIACITLETN